MGVPHKDNHKETNENQTNVLQTRAVDMATNVAREDRIRAERKIVAETLIRVEQALRNLHQHPSQPEQRALAKAQQRANSNHSGFLWMGAVVTMSAFGFLRFGPKLAAQFVTWTRTRQRNQGSVLSSNKISSTVYAKTPTVNRQDSFGPFSHQLSKQRNVRYWTWLVIDAVVSLFGGFVMAERDYSHTFMKRAVDTMLPPGLPRLPGPSCTHTETKCDAVWQSLQERQHVTAMNGLTRRELPCTNETLLLDPQTYELKRLMEFYAACQQRRGV